MTVAPAKSYIDVPGRARRSPAGIFLHALMGVVLSPAYWIAAALRAAPGMAFRARCTKLGLCALLSLKHRLSFRSIFHLLFMPMESTRYFEFDFAWRALEGRRFARMLDVSSPRLLPICLLNERKDLQMDLLNPDPSDLAQTERFIASIGAGKRTTTHECVIDAAPFAPSSFDVITSLSVLEHVPADAAAIRYLWGWLKPGGTLLITVPCMAQPAEQYISRDQWGVLRAQANDGYVFWQRFYDRRMLEENIFSITGAPRTTVIYGEKVSGAHQRNALSKRGDAYYAYWREPFMMATGYRMFDRLEDLPGEGVVGLVFEKPK